MTITADTVTTATVFPYHLENAANGARIYVSASNAENIDFSPWAQYKQSQIKQSNL